MSDKIADTSKAPDSASTLVLFPAFYSLMRCVFRLAVVAALFQVAYGTDSPAGKLLSLAQLKPPLQIALHESVGPVQRETLISGLLVVKRACAPGNGACADGSGCCQLGGQCCKGKYCCDAGFWCYSTGCCKLSQGGCDNKGCCPLGSNCCKGGSCCASGDYCDVVDGQQGCCPIGKVCSGSTDQCDISGYLPCTNDDFCCPPGDTCYRDSSNDPRCRAGGGGSPTTAKKTTTTTTKAATTKPIDTSKIDLQTTTPGSETTNTTAPSRSQTITGASNAITSVPTAAAGSQNIVIDVSDTAISWKGDWATVTSSCSASGSKAKSILGGSIIVAVMQYNFTGTSIYLSLASVNVMYTVTIDGELTGYGDATSGTVTATPANCTYGWKKENLANILHIFEITVFGQSISAHNGRRDDGFWSLQVQNIVITKPDLSSSSVSGTANAGSGSPSSAASYSVPLPWLVILMAFFIFCSMPN
ncbi:hypothetical protein B0H10DRAFT_734137 [Mycena sp. CBHHK59/15]|nr:hypothetical protein B0H10DRAFT_734137 [Mycena sp. CBHHK59/15]